MWGTNTPNTARDERLVNRFDYDGEYGTVLNRFLMQAATDIPLTVYGTGGGANKQIHGEPKATFFYTAMPPELDTVSLRTLHGDRMDDPARRQRAEAHPQQLQGGHGK